MNYIVGLLVVLLCLALFCTIIRKGRFVKLARLYRFLVVIFGIGFFTYWFFERSITRHLDNALSIQIINKLPQTLDFYIIRVDEKPDKKYVTRHIEKIRPEHFRLETLRMNNSDEFWVAGYIGKNMLYFSQHAVPNKNIDQIIEVNNYLLQSAKLSTIAKDLVDKKRDENLSSSIWITLCFLLLFLNTCLMVQRK